MSLTDDDKRWFAEQFTGLESRFAKQFTGLESRLAEQFIGLESKLRAEIKASKEETVSELKQHVEEVETRMLRAFRNYAHPVEARLRVQKITSRATNERLDALEDRVELLEEGGTKPPTYKPESR